MGKRKPVQTSGQEPEAPPVSNELVLQSDGKPILSQPFLFDEHLLPHRPDLVKKAKAFLHTGKIVDKDDETVQAICEALVLGNSAREIAKKWNVSRNTVAHFREALETAGKLEPHKQRLSKGLGRLAEACMTSLISKAESGVLPATVESIAMGVAIDKKGQIDAGVVPGTQLAEAELDAEAIRAKWAQMKAAKVIDIAPTEKESGGKDGKAQ